jgi:hypothetical protein
MQVDPKKCSIEGCGGSRAYKAGSPYCSVHESLFGDEWSWCGYMRCLRPVPISEFYCSLHRGADYIPRTRVEEVEPDPLAHLYGGPKPSTKTPAERAAEVAEWRDRIAQYRAEKEREE